MLGDLLTYSSLYGWPKIPDLTARSALLALHQDVAQWTSDQTTKDIGTAAGQIIRDLYEVPLAATINQALQKAVVHVITALREDQPGMHGQAERELAAARIWVEHARLVSTRATQATAAWGWSRQ